MTDIELPHEVDLELAHVLVGTMRRAVGARRSLSLDTNISTVPSCPALNNAVRAVSGMGATWADEMTWRLIREEVEGATKSDEIEALMALLALGHFDGLSQIDRRVAAIKALHLTDIVAPDSIRIKYVGSRAVFDSDVLRRTVPVLRNLIRTSLGPNRLQSRARTLMGSPPIPPNAGQLNVDPALRRLGSAPTRFSHYLPRLTTQVLVSQLSCYEPEPVQEPPVDRIPVLPTPIHELNVNDINGYLQSPGTRVLLTGGPGYGKSTFVRGVTMLRLRAGLPTLLVSAAALAERTSLTDAVGQLGALALIVEECRATLGLAFLGEEADYLARIAKEPDLCLIIDGLDEVPEGLRAIFYDVISELSAIKGSTLATARSGVRFPALDGWKSLEMARFSSASAFIDLWFEGRRDHPGRAQAMATLDNPEYKQIHDSPLLVGFIAQVSDLQRKFTTISDLYDQYVVLSLERSWKGGSGIALDDALIFRLKGIAVVVAWKMATGESRAPTEPSGWRGQATLAQILAAVPERDHELVVSLLKIEALFVIAVEGASRLHTSYAWNHRTIQEHLVGAQLRDELASPSGIARVVALSIDQDGWTTSLVHAISHFDDADRVRVLQALSEVEGSRIDQLLAEQLRERIVASSPADSGVWRWLFESESTADVDQPMVDVVGDSSKALHACVLRSTIDAGRFAQLVWTGGEDIIIAGLIDQVAADIRADSTAPHWMRTTMFIFQSQTAPRTAFLDYFDALRGGSQFHVLEPEGCGAPLTDVEVLSGDLDSLSWPEPRWRAVATLLCLSEEGARDVLMSRPSGRDEILLAELMIWLDHVDKSDPEISVATQFGEANGNLPELVSRAMSGEFGEFVAYTVAKQLPQKDITKLSDTTSLWAGVAFLERSFAEGNFLEAPDRTVDHLAIVRSFGVSWLGDPRKMIEYLEALHQLQRSLRLVASEELLYAQLRLHREADSLITTSANSVFTIADFDAMAAAHFARMGFDLFLQTLQATQAHDWLPLEGKIPALAAVWGKGVVQTAAGDEDSSAALRHYFEDERFRRVVNWGARGGLPILKSLDDTPFHMRIQLERLLDNVDPRLLDVKENLDWIDEQQATIQGLHRWKSQREDWLTRMRRRSGARNNSGPVSASD